MANRSTFSSILPRDLGRFIALSNPAVDATYNKDLRKLFLGAGPEGYQRELRKMFAEAHKNHKAYKIKRLAKEDIGDSKATVKDALVADHAADVA